MKANVALKAVIAIAYFAVAGFAICVGLVRPGVTGYHKAMLEDMIYGKAHMPFVKRQLVPLVVRGAAKTIPPGIHESLSARFEGSAVVKKLSLPADYAVETILTLLVMYASLVGFLVLLRHFVVMFSNVGAGASHLIAIATGVLLPVMFAGQMYIYDFTQLLLFTAGLILLYQQRWAMFYPVFILACINKETSILLAGVLVLWKGMEIFKSQWRIHVLCQFAIGFGTYFTIGYIFRKGG